MITFFYYGLNLSRKHAETHHTYQELTDLKCTQNPDSNLQLAHHPFPINSSYPFTYGAALLTFLACPKEPVAIHHSVSSHFSCDAMTSQPWCYMSTYNSSFLFPMLHALVYGHFWKTCMLISQKGCKSFLLHIPVP